MTAAVQPAPAPPAAGPAVRHRGIDALRGVAVLLVMLRHGWPETFPGAGLVGVVMFFGLSGYLITGVLLDDLTRHGQVRWRRFYLRRAVRLLPALLALLGVLVAVTLALDPLGDRDQLLRTVVIALTWTANLPVGLGSDATYHLWTLATEEQFYLLWPLVLAVGAAHGRLGRAIAVTGVSTTAACLATVAWLAEDPDLAYALPTTWATCFVVGGAARWWVARSGPRGWRPAPWLVAACLAVLAVLAVLPLRDHAATYLVGGPTIAALTCVCILGALGAGSTGSWPPALAPVLTPLVLLGTVSYGAYLWNYPLTLWLRPELGAAAGPVAFAATLVAATLSWRWIEAPTSRRIRP